MIQTCHIKNFLNKDALNKQAYMAYKSRLNIIAEI